MLKKRVHDTANNVFVDVDLTAEEVTALGIDQSAAAAKEQASLVAIATARADLSQLSQDKVAAALAAVDAADLAGLRVILKQLIRVVGRLVG